MPFSGEPNSGSPKFWAPVAGSGTTEEMQEPSAELSCVHQELA